MVAPGIVGAGYYSISLSRDASSSGKYTFHNPYFGGKRFRPAYITALNLQDIIQRFRIALMGG